jgi:hypothetical protein
VFKTRALAEQAILRDVPENKREDYNFDGDDSYGGARIEEFTVISNLDRVEVWQANNDYWGKWRTHSELVYKQDTDEIEEKAWTVYSHDKKLWANGRAVTKERALKIAQDAHAKAKAEKAGL